MPGPAASSLAAAALLLLNGEGANGYTTRDAALDALIARIEDDLAAFPSGPSAGGRQRSSHVPLGDPARVDALLDRNRDESMRPSRHDAPPTFEPDASAPSSVVVSVGGELERRVDKLTFNDASNDRTYGERALFIVQRAIVVYDMMLKIAAELVEQRGAGYAWSDIVMKTDAVEDGQEEVATLPLDQLKAHAQAQLTTLKQALTMEGTADERKALETEALVQQSLKTAHGNQYPALKQLEGGETGYRVKNPNAEAAEVSFADGGWDEATDEEKCGFWTQWAYQWTVMDARIMKDDALVCQLQDVGSQTLTSDEDVALVTDTVHAQPISDAIKKFYELAEWDAAFDAADPIKPRGAFAVQYDLNFYLDRFITNDKSKAQNSEGALTGWRNILIDESVPGTGNTVNIVEQDTYAFPMIDNGLKYNLYICVVLLKMDSRAGSDGYRTALKTADMLATAPWGDTANGWKATLEAAATTAQGFYDGKHVIDKEPAPEKENLDEARDLEKAIVTNYMAAVKEYAEEVERDVQNLDAVHLKLATVFLYTIEGYATPPTQQTLVAKGKLERYDIGHPAVDGPAPPMVRYSPVGFSPQELMLIFYENTADLYVHMAHETANVKSQIKYAERFLASLATLDSGIQSAYLSPAFKVDVGAKQKFAYIREIAMALNRVRKSTEMTKGDVGGNDPTGVDSPEMQAEMFKFVIAAVRVVMYLLLCEAPPDDGARVVSTLIITGASTTTTSASSAAGGAGAASNAGGGGGGGQQEHLPQVTPMTWEDEHCTALTDFAFQKYKEHVEEMLSSKEVNKWDRNDGSNEWNAEALQGKLIGLLFVLLRNHAAMLKAFTTYSNTATLVKYYCPELTTSTDGNVQGGWVQKEEFETNCASLDADKHKAQREQLEEAARLAMAVEDPAEQVSEDDPEERKEEADI